MQGRQLKIFTQSTSRRLKTPRRQKQKQSTKRIGQSASSPISCAKRTELEGGADTDDELSFVTSESSPHECTFVRRALKAGFSSVYQRDDASTHVVVLCYLHIPRTSSPRAANLVPCVCILLMRVPVGANRPLVKLLASNAFSIRLSPDPVQLRICQVRPRPRSHLAIKNEGRRALASEDHCCQDQN